MILSAQSIVSRRVETPMISPMVKSSVVNGMTFGLGPSGYDIRIKETILMLPKGYRLASSIEYFNLPDDIMARVHDKSSWARRGITVQNTVAEPGWYGFLTLEIKNHNWYPYIIKAGSPIAQIVFETLDEPTVLPYKGKYQGQASGPQKAIFERK
jgi:dCTP deaminase